MRDSRTIVALGMSCLLTGVLAATYVSAAAPSIAQPRQSMPDVMVGVNHNDGSPRQIEFPEFLFRDATSGHWPVPILSTSDLAQGVQPVVLRGTPHSLSGAVMKLTDGTGPVDEDDPGNCFFFENGEANCRVRISLPNSEPVSQVNVYSWHRNGLNGGIRAPQLVDVYASDGEGKDFALDDPSSSGYVYLARIDTMRPGNANVQAGQHGSSVFRSDGRPLGKFKHFVFDVHTPIGGFAHTFLAEIDLVRAEDPPSVADATPAGRSFDERVAPLLSRRCLDCHNGTDKKGGLDLSRMTDVTAGGDGGPALVPGKPDESYLIARIDADEMPPKHPLSAEEKQLLRDWIAGGAAWGHSPIDRFQFTSDTRAGFDWWALKPLREASADEGTLDAFVLEKLAAKGLQASPPADRRTLIRRVTFDLHGLPPTPEEVAEFVADAAPDAYDRLIDRLLASPRYGERWARHWLDVVRFAESQGFERNKFYPSAWKYRDWVIEAFNNDMPYDEFVRLQLAGDRLRPNDPEALVATGYLTCGTHDALGLTQGSEVMRANTREDELENLVGNVGQTFLGLTINCARCHDHKFDPIHQREFFELAATFGGVERKLHQLPPPDAESAGSSPRAAMESADAQLRNALGAEGEALLLAARAEKYEAALAALMQAQARLAKQEKHAGDANERLVLQDRRRDAAAAEDELRYAQNPFSIATWDKICDGLPEDRRQAAEPWVAELSRLELRDHLSSGGAIQSVASASPQFFHVHNRGNFRDPAAVVTPRGLECVQELKTELGVFANSPEAERRLAMTNWITDTNNPLAARVIVNRLWHYHFGLGLVDTPNDFGFSGGRPSHPKLLDWLASSLVREGWSLKKVQRQIVLSATYRQSSANNSQGLQTDADNRLLWRKSPQRLDAETVHDSVLAVCGRLNLRMGGPSFRDVQVDVSVDNATYTPLNVFSGEVNRRAIYRTVVRAATPPLLDTLDCADPTVATPRRAVTTTPLQALSLLNNPFMSQAAKAFAKRVQGRASGDVGHQITEAYSLAFARSPLPEESEAAAAFVAKYGLVEFCLLLFNSNEFLYVD